MDTKIVVILAAGKGTRIREHEPVKPLTMLGGLPLIIRVILSFQIQGVEKVIVVVGYQKNEIINLIKSEKRIKIKVEFVENKEYELSNGISLLCTKEKVDSNFFLSMSDHVFDLSIIESLKKEGLKDNDVVLCVDYKLDTIFDMNDATKVLVKDKKIVDIGKKITDYNAVDTGIFLCSPAIFDALEEAKNEQGGNCSLSDGIKKLAKKNRCGAHDIKEAFWQDIDNKEMLDYAEKKLYENLTKKADGIISKYINRKISVFLTKHFFIKTSLTPNMLSIIAFIVGVCGSFFVWLGYNSYFLTLLGFLLFQFSSILDGNDGEVARLKLLFTKKGEWLDTILDDLNNAFFIFALGENIYLATSSSFWLIGAIVAVIFYYIYSFTVYTQLLSLPNKPGTVYAFAWWFERENPIYKKEKRTIVDMFRYLGRRDLYIFLFLLLALFNLKKIAFVYAFFIGVFHGFFAIIHLIKKNG